MITGLIIGFIIYKVFGKGNPFKREGVKVPVIDDKGVKPTLK